jgi:hypothetical protein
MWDSRKNKAVIDRQVGQEIAFLTYRVEITVMTPDKTPGLTVSSFWFGRLAIKMGFVIADDRNQPCN